MQEFSRLAITLHSHHRANHRGLFPGQVQVPTARGCTEPLSEHQHCQGSPAQSLRVSFKTPPCTATSEGALRSPGTAAQAERAKGGGTNLGHYHEGTCILLNSAHLTLPPGLTDQPLEKYCLLEKEYLHTFFKFFIFLSTSGSPVVMAGTVFCGVWAWAGPCCASALASCGHRNTI